MKYVIIMLLAALTHYSVNGQIYEFPAVTKEELSLKKYDLDSSANAFVLAEKGKTSINISDNDRGLRVFHHYKTKIKILTQEGYNHANIEIPLYKIGSDFEDVTNIKASSYNLVNGKIEVVPIKSKDIFEEKLSEYAKKTKFTIPNIKVGSVIEIEYTIVSPDIFNFRTWHFQTDIPKVKSEYNVLIPAVFRFNVTLKGHLKLDDTKSKVYKECFLFNGNRIDCSDITYTMSSIPSFKEEAYMLAPKNYISSVNFELEEMTTPNGTTKRFTKTWADVDKELLQDKDFGGQLKKEKLFQELFAGKINLTTDKYDNSKQIFKLIKESIKWNNFYGRYCQNGVEDALKKKTGNVADINIALIAALNAADIEAFPVLVSTRNNGIPNSLHPVISDFNYVIAAIKVNGDLILADASDPYVAYGELPLRTINDRGRIIYSKKSSDWIPLINLSSSSANYSFEGSLDLDGKLIGTLTSIYLGLDAQDKRHEIVSFPTEEEYAEKLDEKLTNIKIKNCTIKNLDDSNFPLIEVLDIEAKFSDPIEVSQFSLNPIFIERVNKNPFNLDDRTYPVDIGSKRDEFHTMKIKIPDNFQLTDAPKSINLALPENSARYIFKHEFKDNTLSVNQSLSLKKAIYSSDEYFGLKELFSRVIQQQKIDFQFKKP